MKGWFHLADIYDVCIEAISKLLRLKQILTYVFGFLFYLFLLSCSLCVRNMHLHHIAKEKKGNMPLHCFLKKRKKEEEETCTYLIKEKRALTFLHLILHNHS